MSKATFSFIGKKVLVTGAGRGIGREITKALVAAGAETFALSKTSKNLQSLVNEIPSIHPLHFDLSDWQSTMKAVEEVGPVDLLVNNAGVVVYKPFLETEKSEIDHLFEVNLKGVINVSQVVVKNMINSKIAGSIVNISSLASSRYIQGLGVYGSIKAAIDQTTRVMAKEFGQHQIRVNAVNPTLVWTDLAKDLPRDSKDLEPLMNQTPLGRAAEISEVVDPVLFLLSDSASMITGTTLYIDGGYTT